jgi:hypothetical protein
VIPVGVKHLKVLWPVVPRRVVPVMNHLRGQQVAAKGFLCHKAMLTYVAILASAGMLWHMNKDVTLLVWTTPALPARVF